MEKKKSLGQHFLTSSHYLSLIADTAKIEEGEQVLEIGPGEGTLTEALLSRGAVVHAIEKDYRLIPILEEKFKKEITEEKFFLTEGDALKKNIEIQSPYKLVANIPYYITGAIIEKYLSSEKQPSAMVLLVQKEVAERIACEKKESILSLSVKAYGTPKYIKTVPAGAFSPPPKVDSAVLAIENISRDNFANKKEEEKFFELLHAGFAHKRKLLKRNLEGMVEITDNVRAEDVPLSQWLEFTADLSQRSSS